MLVYDMQTFSLKWGAPDAASEEEMPPPIGKEIICTKK